MMKKILVVGRCWKFLDFVIPTVDSVIDYNDNIDFIIIDNKSSRSDNIKSYCKHLLKNGTLKAFISMDKNYFGNVYYINQYLMDIYKQYDYICFTDMDMQVLNPQKNWLHKMSGILERNYYIGAVSIDFAPMDKFDDGFVFAKSIPTCKLPNENFSSINTDGWFYMTRAVECADFIKCKVGQMGPGMHGYNKYCETQGLLYGRTNIEAKHFGWLRFETEWSSAYQESGIHFARENMQHSNMEYLAKQGNFSQSLDRPNEKSYIIYTKESVV